MSAVLDISEWENAGGGVSPLAHGLYFLYQSWNTSGKRIENSRKRVENSAK